MENVCPLCNSSSYSVIGKPRLNSISKNLVKENYQVVQCNKCSFYYVLPKISFTDEEWGKLYHSEYFQPLTKWLEKKRKEDLVERFDTALKFIKPGEEKKLLDIGTGEGKTLLEGLARGFSVTGIDIVDNRIQEAKKESITFVRAHFLEYDFRGEKFDFIYIDSVLEHVLTPKEYLSKGKDLLKPGGVIYIGVPNEDSLFNDVRKAAFAITGKREFSSKIDPFNNSYHINGFNGKSLQFLVQSLSLKVCKMRNFGRKMSFLGESPNHKGFWVDLLFLFPVEIIGNLLQRDVYYELYLSK